MAKFLILTHPVEPPTDSQFARIDSCIRHFVDQQKSGRAQVYPAAGRKGYAIVVAVDSHDELIDIMHKHPMVQDEETEVFPLGTLDGEVITAGEAKYGDLADI